MADAQRPPNPLDMLRDRRALIDTGLGPVAFVTVNAATDLNTAAIVAVAISVVVAIVRAIRREPLTNAIPRPITLPPASSASAVTYTSRTSRRASLYTVP